MSVGLEELHVVGSGKKLISSYLALDKSYRNHDSDEIKLCRIFALSIRLSLMVLHVIEASAKQNGTTPAKRHTLKELEKGIRLFDICATIIESGVDAYNQEKSLPQAIEETTLSMVSYYRAEVERQVIANGNRQQPWQLTVLVILEYAMHLKLPSKMIEGLLGLNRKTSHIKHLT